MIEQHLQHNGIPASLKELAQWQRLSAIALVYFCLRQLKAVFGNFSTLAPLLILSYQGIQRYPGYFAAAFVVAILVIVTFALVSFLVFRFRVTEDSVEIHSGVLRKKQLNLPFNRIQNVRLLQPIYYRFTGHYCVVLDTAGSSQQEAELSALSKGLAEQLQQAIYKANTQPVPEIAVAEDSLSSLASAMPQHAAQSQEQLLCKRSVKDLVFYGISNNRVMLALGLAAPFYKTIFNVVNEQLQQLGIDLSIWFNPEQQSWLWLGFAAFVLTMLIMLLITLCSIAASVISYYQFQLLRQEDRYIRRSGLFTRHEISMKRSRLQWCRLQQDWLDKLFGRCNLHYEQIQSPLDYVQSDASQGQIMVPALEPGVAHALLCEVLPDNQLNQQQFRPVNWRYVVPSLLFLWVPLLLVSQYLLWPDSPVLAVVCLLALLLLAVLLVMRWRRFGYAMDQHYLYLRQGVIGTDYYCVPLYKLQQFSLKQHWFMQRAGLKHLTVVYAAGSLTMPYMPAEDAKCIADYALYQAQASGKSWM